MAVNVLEAKSQSKDFRLNTRPLFKFYPGSEDKQDFSILKYFYLDATVEILLLILTVLVFKMLLDLFQLKFIISSLLCLEAQLQIAKYFESLLRFLLI